MAEFEKQTQPYGESEDSDALLRVGEPFRGIIIATAASNLGKPVLPPLAIALIEAWCSVRS